MIYDEFDDNSELIQTHAKAVNKHPDFNLLAGIDYSIEKGKIFKEKYKKNFFTKVEAFNMQIQIDLVIIATPTTTHLEIIKKTINLLRPKLILIEKPLSYKFEEAQEIINLCIKEDIELCVNYIRRCDPGVIEIKKLFENRSIDIPLKGICWYSKGLYNNASHFINLLSYWLGDMKSIKIINEGRLINDIDPEPDFLIDFEKGSIIFRSAWEEFFSYYAVELIFRTGQLRYDKGGGEIYFYKLLDKERNIKSNILSSEKYEIKSGMDIYQYNVLEEIKKIFKGENATICKGEESLRTQEIIYLISKKLKN